MAISKVTYAGNTLIDLTGDTVTPENLLSGATAHAANGEEITGIVEDKKGELEAQIADLRNQIGSLNANLANKLYPVGSIYISVNATNPAELFGGTWEQIKDRFLLAAGNTYAAGSTGGEATHTLSAAEMPSHTHTVRLWNPAGAMGPAKWASKETYGATLETSPYGATAPTPFTWNNSTPMVADNGNGDPAGNTDFSGGGKQHNNMPPYLAVYMWKRIA